MLDAIIIIKKEIKMIKHIVNYCLVYCILLYNYSYTMESTNDNRICVLCAVGNTLSMPIVTKVTIPFQPPLEQNCVTITDRSSSIFETNMTTSVWAPASGQLELLSPVSEYMILIQALNNTLDIQHIHRITRKPGPPHHYESSSLVIPSLDHSSNLRLQDEHILISLTTRSTELNLDIILK